MTKEKEIKGLLKKFIDCCLYYEILTAQKMYKDKICACLGLDCHSDSLMIHRKTLDYKIFKYETGYVDPRELEAKGYIFIF